MYLGSLPLQKPCPSFCGLCAATCAFFLSRIPLEWRDPWGLCGRGTESVCATLVIRPHLPPRTAFPPCSQVCLHLAPLPVFEPLPRRSWAFSLGIGSAASHTLLHARLFTHLCVTSDFVVQRLLESTPNFQKRRRVTAQGSSVPG